MNEQKIAPVLSDAEKVRLYEEWKLEREHTGHLALVDDTEQAVLARVGAVRDQALEALEGVIRVADRATVEFDAAHEAIRALKGTPAAAVADAQPVSGPLRSHIQWIHSVMRETGHCIDGGVCHHNCRPKPEAPCFRQRECEPLTGSRLNDDWTLPAPQPSSNPRPLAAVERDAARYRFLRSIGHAQLNVMAHHAGDSMDKGIDAAIAASKEGASHG